MRKILLAALLGTAAPLPAYAVSDSGYSLTIQGGAEDGSGYVRMRDGQTYQICLSSTHGEISHVTLKGRGGRENGAKIPYGYRVKSDVAVSVDGLPIGVFRLEGLTRTCLEGPPKESGRFTFYKSDTQGGVLSGSNQTRRDDRGRITARFIPQVESEISYQEPPRIIRNPDGSEGVEPIPMSGSGFRPRDPGLPSSSPGTMSVRGGELDLSSGVTGLSDSPPTDNAYSSGVTGLTGSSSQSFTSANSITLDIGRAVTLELRLVHDQALEPPPQLYVVPPPATYSPSGAPTIHHGHPPPPTYYSLPPPANPRPLPGRMIPAPPPVRDY